LQKAKQTHTELLGNPEATKDQIHDALVLVGKQEFPYRRAYTEMTGTVSEDHRLELVLEHLEPNVKTKVQSYLGHGVTLEEFVKSSMFETELTPEEQYQVEDGILHAEDHVKEELPEKIEKHRKEYDALVEEWKKKQEVMQAKIDELRALATTDPKWKDEILDKVKTLEEGWSIVERDPDLIEIEKEIEYYKGAMSEEV